MRAAYRRYQILEMWEDLGKGGWSPLDRGQQTRWDLVLDILNEGADLFALRRGLLLNRDTAGPASDGHIHIGVVANPPREQAHIRD